MVRKNKRYDWLRIREEYIAGDDKVTHDFLCSKYGMAKSVLGRKCASEAWVHKREQFRAELSVKIKNEMIKRHSSEILKIADFLQVVRTYYKKHVFRRDITGRITDTPEDSIPVGMLNEIMAGLEKNVKLTRLIIGESTEVIGVPESWEEKVKRLRAERGIPDDAADVEELNVADKRIDTTKGEKS